MKNSQNFYSFTSKLFAETTKYVLEVLVGRNLSLNLSEMYFLSLTIKSHLILCVCLVKLKLAVK